MQSTRVRYMRAHTGRQGTEFQNKTASKRNERLTMLFVYFLCLPAAILFTHFHCCICLFVCLNLQTIFLGGEYCGCDSGHLLKVQ